jgi:peroxiredoxin
MSEGTRRPLLRVGEPAPDLSLPLANREGTVSLSDYRGKNSLLVAIFRGLHCAFCRRHLAQLSSSMARLRDVGVEVLAITASPLERARLYVRYRPVAVTLAADPELSTHARYGLPFSPPTPELQEWLRVKYLELARRHGVELPDTTSYREAVDTLGRLEGFELIEADWNARLRGEGRTGQFLLDESGIVRWTNIEGTTEATGLGGLPSDGQLLAAALPLKGTSSR